MGNALRLLRKFCDSLPLDLPGHSAGCSALAQDLVDFEATGQVPEGLSKYVTSKKKTQAVWYEKLLAAWKEARPPPRNGYEASAFVVETLRGHRKADVQGLLLYYNLNKEEDEDVAPSSAANSHPPAGHRPTQIPANKWPQGVQYELRTLPVDAKSVTDGDTINVYVDVSETPREKALIPKTVLKDIADRRAARRVHDYSRADALEKKIRQAGYKVFDSKHGGDIISRKYRVRLRGVDAPESHMPYGPESKATLLSLVENRPLNLLVYAVDRYGRIVADLYSSEGLVQEVLLKKGCAWHYNAYDKRPDFEEWEQQARAAHRGLWAVAHPQKPWEYRKEHRK